jgi:hypothetical protein
LSHNQICDYLKINKDTLKRKVWNFLNGFIDGEKEKTRYLNENEEEVLAEEIRQHEDSKTYLSKQDVENRVVYFIY